MVHLRLVKEFCKTIDINGDSLTYSTRAEIYERYVLAHALTLKSASPVE